MRVYNLISEIMADHVLFYAERETAIIYDSTTYVDIKGVLDEKNIQNSVFIYPTKASDLIEPDYWCSVSWIENGSLQTYGFNWMSIERKEELDKTIKSLEEKFNANA